MLMRMHGWLSRFRRDQRGVSAVEFAMLLPLMVTLYLGGVEVSQAVGINRKVSLTARAVADLVARTTKLTKSEMTNILDASTAVAAPYPVSNIKVKVSSVRIKTDGTAVIDWSEAKNASKREKGETVTVPNALKVPNKETYLIWAEVEYDYKPSIGYVLTGTIKLSDTIYMAPRMSDKVAEPA